MVEQMPDLDRFWEKVDVAGPDECWLWLASVNGGEWGGYGQIWNGERNLSAHRVSWVLEHGDIPKGVNVLHACDVPPCVNPKHLFLGTQADNAADMWSKGRQGGCYAAGEKNGFSKLAERQVRAIRRRYADGGVTMAELGAEYGCNKTAIWKIVHRESWPHVR